MSQKSYSFSLVQICFLPQYNINEYDKILPNELVSDISPVLFRESGT